MPNKSKAKGNRVENEICKMFNQVFNLSFKRVPTSGAMTGGLNAQILAMLSDSQKLLLRGDIIVPDELSKVVIECKGKKKFAYNLLITGSAEIDKHIEQLNCDLCEDDLIGLLIVKVNNKGCFVCYNTKNKSDLLGKDINYITYNYDNTKYIIESFTNEWIERNKDTLLRLCSK